MVSIEEKDFYYIMQESTVLFILELCRPLGYQTKDIIS